MPTLNLVAKPGVQEIVVTRVFDATPVQVFKAMTDPSLIPEWWGPRNLTTTIDRFELKKGGVWRFFQHDAESHEYTFNGVYHSVEVPERLVYTFEFEGMPGHVILETVTFEPFEGKTRVIDQSVFQSVADRDGMLQTGMEAGVTETYERLSELLQRTGLKA